jgi:hypothetical protein
MILFWVLKTHVAKHVIWFVTWILTQTCFCHIPPSHSSFVGVIEKTIYKKLSCCNMNYVGLWFDLTKTATYLVWTKTRLIMFCIEMWKSTFSLFLSSPYFTLTISIGILEFYLCCCLSGSIIVLNANTFGSKINH